LGPSNDATGLTLSEVLLRRMTTQNDYGKKYDGVGSYIECTLGMIFHGSSNAGSSMEETSSKSRRKIF
jgi:hypothetical protein